MKQYALICTLAATVGLTAVPALAEQEAAADTFKNADFDGDGKVSFEEYRNRATRVFHQMDTNSDGRLTGDEHPPAKAANGKLVEPGTVTIDAFTDSLQEFFTQTDKSKDGSLSPDEWSAAPKSGKSSKR